MHWRDQSARRSILTRYATDPAQVHTDDLSILGSESHREDAIPSGSHAFRARNISQPTNPNANQIVEHRAHNYYQPVDYEYHE